LERINSFSKRDLICLLKEHLVSEPSRIQDAVDIATNGTRDRAGFISIWQGIMPSLEEAA
jgi:hypothetical protein